jgi:hypothetical protein
MELGERGVSAVHRGSRISPGRLAPHQRAFVARVVRDLDTFGQARFVLADDVGLGKTVQLGMAAELIALTRELPVLVLASKNLLLQWQEELDRMAGHPAARQARQRLGGRDRSSETEAGRRRDPEGRSQRSAVRTVGRMGPADEDAVPQDHLVRAIAGVLDLSWVHAALAPHYPKLRRPSIDPVPMIRMLVVGYVFAIRSERALCRDVQVNLAYRWFCGLSIEDKVPDHSAFSRARK